MAARSACMAATGPPPSRARTGQQVIGVGEFRIPFEHGAQVLHHVGQSLNVGVPGLRHAVFQHRKVVADPHIAPVESGSVTQFFGGVFKLAVLQVVPGQSAMGDLIAGDCDRKSRASSSFIVYASFSLAFLAGVGLGAVASACNSCSAAVAAVGNSDSLRHPLWRAHQPRRETWM